MPTGTRCAVSVSRRNGSRSSRPASVQHPARHVHSRALRQPHVPLSPRRHARVRAFRHGAAQPEFPRALERRRSRDARGAPRGHHREPGAPASSRARRSSGMKPAATFEIVVLPLVHTGSAIDRFLCSISLFDEPELARRASPSAGSGWWRPRPCGRAASAQRPDAIVRQPGAAASPCAQCPHRPAGSPPVPGLRRRPQRRRAARSSRAFELLTARRLVAASCIAPAGAAVWPSCQNQDKASQNRRGN